ncbi:MAG: helix-turn-helix domain-containing protein, partial [Candidatus Enteromonas sp.]
KKLGISLSYLSAIETGTRTVPDGFIEKLSQKYKLSKEKTKNLSTALNHSMPSVDIPLASALPMQRDLAVMLARKLPDLSDEDCEKMLSILKEND